MAKYCQICKTNPNGCQISKCGIWFLAVASTTLEVANFTVTKEHILSAEKRIKNISAK
jgi:hypothetical protein